MIRQLVSFVCGVAIIAAVPPVATAQDATHNGSSLPLKHDPQPTSAEISARDLMTRLYIFADDSMMGRETGTRGHLMSTVYIANELRRLGLKPAGDNGTFFQNVPMIRRAFDAKSTIVVDDKTLHGGIDFIGMIYVQHHDHLEPRALEQREQRIGQTRRQHDRGARVQAQTPQM